MDKIILHSQDVETLLKWRDNNADLVRRNLAPFKSILCRSFDRCPSLLFRCMVDGSSAAAARPGGYAVPGGIDPGIEKSIIYRPRLQCRGYSIGGKTQWIKSYYQVKTLKRC